MIRRFIPILVFALFGYYLVGANFNAKLGMIDDHEIPLFLGSDGLIKIGEIPAIISSTELGKWGEYQRFRPSYYTLRILESALWQDNAMLWYGFRYIMLVLSFYLGWLIAARFFPKLISYLLVFYIMTMSFWPDLLARLGPSEIYTVPAILMFTYGLLTNKLWLVAAGYAISVGAKENLLILFPFLLSYAGYQRYRKKMSSRDLIVYLILFAYTVWIVAGIYLATMRSGSDVYGKSISYAERLANIYMYKRYIVESRHLQLPLLVFSLSFIGICRMVYKKGLKQVLKSTITKHLVAAGAIVIMIISQYLFYNGNFPMNMRYDFPVMLLFPVLQLIALSLAIAIMPKKIKKVTQVVTNLGLVIVLGYFIYSRGYAHIREQTIVNATATATFAEKLDMITLILRDDPERPLVFVSQYFLDYEPIVSISRYLNARGVTNEFVLDYESKEPSAEPLVMELENRMKMVMKGEADPDRVFGRFTAKEEVKPPCYKISFGKAISYDGCEHLATF